MPSDDQTKPPLHLTTKEVADLLRVKERKVYDLAAAGEIPHRRITGKLLFPRSEIMDWMADTGTPAQAVRPDVLTGSHDPLLDWAIRESGSGLAILLNGSSDGLTRFAEGGAAISGMHIPDKDGWNIQSVQALGLRDCVLVAWARRARGLILRDGMEGRISSFADLRGTRVALRQPGAGARSLFDALMTENDLALSDLELIDGLARTENDAAAAVASGEADAAIGIEAMARQYHLPFLPILDECFDLLIDRRAYFSEPVQTLMAFAAGTPLIDKAKALGGYDVRDLGQVRWLSP